LKCWRLIRVANDRHRRDEGDDDEDDNEEDDRDDRDDRDDNDDDNDDDDERRLLLRTVVLKALAAVAAAVVLKRVDDIALVTGCFNMIEERTFSYMPRDPSVRLLLCVILPTAVEERLYGCVCVVVFDKR
jgi:hypothetical protein